MNTVVDIQWLEPHFTMELCIDEAYGALKLFITLAEVGAMFTLDPGAKKFSMKQPSYFSCTMFPAGGYASTK